MWWEVATNSVSTQFVIEKISPSLDFYLTARIRWSPLPALNMTSLPPIKSECLICWVDSETLSLLRYKPPDLMSAIARAKGMKTLLVRVVFTEQSQHTIRLGQSVFGRYSTDLDSNHLIY